MKQAKSIACLLLALVMLLSAGACTQSSGEKVTMNIALGGDIIRLDPAFAYDNETSVVIDNITEGLLTHNPDNSIKCLLAESWSATDPVTYVYKLRQDVKFSDGSAMTADDVVFSLTRHQDEALASYMGWMFGNVESIEKTGDFEVTVKLLKPDATWQYVLATSAGMIVKKSYCESKGADFGSASGGIIGTGPFEYVSWQSGSKVTLKKNANYWDKTAKTNIDEMVFSIVADDTTLMTALESGQIDFCATFSNTLVESIRKIDKVRLLDTPGMGLTYITFNTAREPFDDVNVRKAIACAIDLDTMHTNVIKDAGIKGGILPMSDSLFTIEPQRWKDYAASLPQHEFNIEKAKEYLSKSGVPNGFKTTLMVNQSNSMRYNIALVVQQALKEIDIEVEIIGVTGDEFFTYQFGNVLDANGIRDYDMLVATWGSDYPDPAGNLDPLYATAGIAEGGSNSASYSNPELDSLLAEAASSTDQTKRVDLLLKACDIIVEEMPYYVFNYPRIFVIIGKNFEYNDTNIFSAWDWNFKNMVKK